MTVGKRKNRRQSTFDDVTPVYTAVKTTCGCNEPRPVVIKNDRLFCKRCGRPMAISLESEWCRSIEILVKVLSETMAPGSIQPRPAEAPGVIESTMTADAANERERELNNRIAELESEMKEAIHQRNSEIERIVKENKTLENRISKLTSELDDVDSTLKQRTRELKEMMSVDVRTAFDDVMEFAAGVNSTVAENDDLSSIRETVDIRTERLIMNLKNHGIEVSAHKRGDIPENVPMDIIPVSTDDQSLDMTVVRSHKYGCRFHNDVYAYIPEEASIYRYESNRIGESGEERKTETRLMAREADI